MSKVQNATSQNVKVEDTVFVSGFNIPAIELLAGSESDGASVSLLRAQASDLLKRSKAISDRNKEAILPSLEKIKAYGEGSGKRAGQTDDQYAASNFKITLADATQVTIPKSVVFGKTAVAMVQYLIGGGLALAKFETFVLSNVILKKSEATTNAGKGEQYKAVIDDGDECIVSVQSAGSDKDGNLKGWFEVLALSAKAVYVQQDELKALKYLDGMERKTGLTKETLQAIVQMIIDATVGKEMRKLAKKFVDRAEDKQKAGIQARYESERLGEIQMAAKNGKAEVQPTKGIGQAH